MAYSSGNRLELYRFVEGLEDAVRNDDLTAAQHWRQRLSFAVEPYAAAGEPLHDAVKQLFEISGKWVRGVGNRDETKHQINKLVERVIKLLDTTTT